MRYLEPYAEAYATWLRDEAEVVDTTHLTPAEAARRIAGWRHRACAARPAARPAARECPSS